MVEHAWWPLNHYRLSFGSQDKMRDAIRRLELPNAEVIARRRTLRGQLHFDVNYERREGLLRYVPSRLIRPWFANEARGLEAENRITACIEDASRKHFVDLKDPPLYRILSDHIELHPAWLEYFTANIGVIQPWANWHWLVWLQARNQSVPEIAEKLGRPPGRRNLSTQKRLWQEAIKTGSIFCIYTGKPIAPNFVLDHFVPRSFIGHDQLWNLVPVDIALNSIKGDQLPDRRFIDQLSKVQTLAIGILDGIDPPPAGWRKARDQYAIELHLEDLKDEHAMAVAYRATIGPLIDIATSMGFPEKWEPRQ